MDRVFSGDATPSQVAGFVIALRAKGETVEELRALADVMLAHAHRFQAPAESIDIVGTGGDRAPWSISRRCRRSCSRVRACGSSSTAIGRPPRPRGVRMCWKVSGST